MNQLIDVSHLEQLRTDSVRRVAYLCLFGGVAFLVSASLSPTPEAWAMLSAWLALLGFVAERLSRRQSVVAASFLVVGLLGATVAARVLFPQANPAILFALLVIVAGCVLGWRFSIAIAAIGTLVTAVFLARDGALNVAEGGYPLAMIWLSTAVCWITLDPLYGALAWSWAAYREAQAKRDEARAHQQELAAVLKSLDAAYYQLEAANQEIDRARQVAEEARRVKSEFATTISHELRTPLNLIIGFSELMVLKPDTYGGDPLPTVYRGDVEAIYRNALHIVTLIDDILDLAQIEANRMPIHRQPTSIAQVIDDACATIAGLLRERQLNLITELAPDLPTIAIDPSRIRQVLINLLANAARCTNEGGILVSAALDDTGHEIVVSVADTGEGIDPSELPYVFDEFCRAGDQSRRKSGSGLGLTISKRFVEMHGGNIWVESERGEGSTFRLSLPLAQSIIAAPVSISRGRRVAIANEPERTVILLDGDGPGSRILRRYLDGYHLMNPCEWPETNSGQQEVRPGAALSMSPEHEAIPPTISKIVADLPVIRCSLSGGNVIKVGNVVEYLAKPFTSDQLRWLLNRVCNGARTILVVDDDYEMLALVSRMLRIEAPERSVLTANGGADALALARQNHPDLILLDLLMPDVDGYQVIQDLREAPETRGIPVVVMSARGRDDEAIVASSIQISRPGGLTIGEAIGIVKASLDHLLVPPALDTAQSR